jgi:hypothetical protein
MFSFFFNIIRNYFEFFMVFHLPSTVSFYFSLFLLPSHSSPFLSMHSLLICSHLFSSPFFCLSFPFHLASVSLLSFFTPHLAFPSSSHPSTSCRFLLPSAPHASSLSGTYPPQQDRLPGVHLPSGKLRVSVSGPAAAATTPRASGMAVGRGWSGCESYYLFVFHGFLRFRSTRACPDPVAVCAARSGGNSLGRGPRAAARYSVSCRSCVHTRSAAYRKPCST